MRRSATITAALLQQRSPDRLRRSQSAAGPPPRRVEATPVTTATVIRTTLTDSVLDSRHARLHRCVHRVDAEWEHRRALSAKPRSAIAEQKVTRTNKRFRTRRVLSRHQGTVRRSEHKRSCPRRSRSLQAHAQSLGDEQLGCPAAIRIHGDVGWKLVWYQVPEPARQARSEAGCAARCNEQCADGVHRLSSGTTTVATEALPAP